MPLRHDIIMKFWKHVLDALDDIENENAYYAGGTLCIDRDGVSYCLNLDGSGFVINKKNPDSKKFYQPEFVLSKVRSVYVIEKGLTKHYCETRIGQL